MKILTGLPSPGRSALLAVAAFAVMEPIAALAHRSVMHGDTVPWHRSHHRPPTGGFEQNDLFPVTFAAVTVSAMAAGAAVPRLRVLLPIGAGVTAYGAAYASVHELVIHRRVARLNPMIGRVAERVPALDAVADAHALHHRFAGPPFGMLAPVVPPSVRRRAASSRSDVTARREALRHQA